jgi:hypothetical protein
MAKHKVKFGSRMDAFNAIRIAAGTGHEADKDKLIAAAHKQYPKKK